MLRWLKRRREKARQAAAEADRLLAAQGDGAWDTIYQRCRSPEVDEAERAFSYRVRRIIERRLKMPPRLDTATRYLREP